MPAWILYALAVGIPALGVLGLGLYYLHRWLRQSGSVALVGRSGTGKSTFLHVLQHGEIPQRGLGPTVHQTKEEHVRVGQKEFTVIDSPGDRLRDWFSAFGDSHYVIYFFDANKVGQGDAATLSAIREDSDHLSEMGRSKGRLPGRNRRFLLLGTHTDLFEGIDQGDVRANPEIDNLLAALDCNADRLLLGSLETTWNAKKLVASIGRAFGGSLK